MLPQPGKFACFAQFRATPGAQSGGLNFRWWLLMLYKQLICQLVAWTDWWGCWLGPSRNRKQTRAIRWGTVNGRHELPVTWKVFLHFPASTARVRHVFAWFPAHPRRFSPTDWTAAGVTRTLPGICRPPRACGTLSLSVAAAGACLYKVPSYKCKMLRIAFSPPLSFLWRKSKESGACSAHSSRGNSQESHIVGVRTYFSTHFLWPDSFGKCQPGLMGLI